MKGGDDDGVLHLGGNPSHPDLIRFGNDGGREYMKD